MFVVWSYMGKKTQAFYLYMRWWGFEQQQWKVRQLIMTIYLLQWSSTTENFLYLWLHFQIICFCACFEGKIYEFLIVSLGISLNCCAFCNATCQTQEMWARILNFARSAKNHFLWVLFYFLMCKCMLWGCCEHS